MNTSIPEYESSKKMSDKGYARSTTFWFERADGSVFGLDEPAASDMYRGRQQVIGSQTQKPKLIGTSDGTIYQQAIAEARALDRTEGFEKARERIQRGHQEELDAARGNIRIPRDFNTVDNHGNPVSISDLQRGF